VRKGDMAAAEKHYGKAVELDPKAVDHRIAHARALWRVERAQEAKATLAAAKKLNPSPDEIRAIDQLMKLTDNKAPPIKVSPDPSAAKEAKAAEKKGDQRPSP